MTAESRRILTLGLLVGFMVVFVLLGLAGIVYKINHQLIHVTQSEPAR